MKKNDESGVSVLVVDVKGAKGNLEDASSVYHAMETTIVEVIKLRETELYPQLIKFVKGPQFESIPILSNVTLLESSLKRILRTTSNNLQFLICIMERKHKGYANLKQIVETSVGVVSQCCLYPNLNKLSSQFLANLALKMNDNMNWPTANKYISRIR
ncbi:hypothetical protein JHK85_056702 [Glycine max]|nr:hypothetical protein JHK85_056702 [Glycine max]